MTTAAEASVVFQAVDWREGPPDAAYHVRVFGRDFDNRSVSVRIDGYRPTFYIKLPGQERDPCTQQAAMSSLNTVKFKAQQTFRAAPPNTVAIDLFQAEDCWGFRPEDTRFWFARVRCRSRRVMTRMSRLFAPNFAIEGLGEMYKKGYRLYETNLDPMVRMFHVTGIQPCGLVELRADKYRVIDGDARTTTCEREFIVDYGHVGPFEDPEGRVVPVRIGCFDIEASSSHGDFPLPKKSFVRLANEMCVAWQRVPSRDRTPETVAGWVASALAMATHDTSTEHVSRVFLKPEYRDFVHSANDGGKTLAKMGERAFAALQSGCTPEFLDAQLMAALGIGRDDSDPRRRGGDAPAPYSEYPVEGDMCIQIGLTVNRLGDEVSERSIVVLGRSEPIEGVRVIECRTEAEVLMRFAQLVRESDLDLLSGFNTWGFDWEFMVERAVQLQNSHGQRLVTLPSPGGQAWDEEPVESPFLSAMSKDTRAPAKYVQKKLSSSALGDNFLHFVDIPGTGQFDLMKYAQANFKLDSYSLRNVSDTFLKGDTKVDLSPKELFERFRRGTPEDIRVIAEYAVQDCALCNHLIAKLDVVPGCLAMANVSLVSFMTLFTAGQTKKIQSLVLAETMRQGKLVPSTQDDPEIGGWPDKRCRVPRCGEEPVYAHPWSPGPLRCVRHREEGDVRCKGFQGAIVLDPTDMNGTKGGFISLNHPCAAVDYASLYPSCARSRLMSWDSVVLEKDRDRFLDLPGYAYYTAEFDQFDHDGNVIPGAERRVTYAHREGSDRKPILPLVLEKLLKARKVTRRRIKTKVVTFADGTTAEGIVVGEGDTADLVDPETMAPVVAAFRSGGHGGGVAGVRDKYSELMKGQLDGLQLAFKVSANSCYGALTAPGAAPLKMRDIGQSITAEGRKMVLLAKKISEENGGVVRYGDTDSVFVSWPDIKGPDCLPEAIQRGKELEAVINAQLPPCQEIELEKIAFPMLSFTAKRYVYMNYDPDEPDRSPKMVCMGVQVKKRDQSGVVKRALSGMYDCILGERSTLKALRFVTEYVERLLAGEYELSDLVTSKSLRAVYKDPGAIAHKVLADRIAARNQYKPQVGDRIPYVHVIPKNWHPGMLQGECIEHPDWLREHPDCAKVDIGKYIELIRNPASQLIALFVEDIPGCTQDWSVFPDDKRQAMKEQWVRREIFGPLLERAGRPKDVASGAPRNMLTTRGQRTLAAWRGAAAPPDSRPGGPAGPAGPAFLDEAEGEQPPEVAFEELSVRIEVEKGRKKVKPVKVTVFDRTFDFAPQGSALSDQTLFNIRSIRAATERYTGVSGWTGRVKISGCKKLEAVARALERHGAPVDRCFDEGWAPDVDSLTRTYMTSLARVGGGVTWS